jgi:hypothetical protein
MPNLWDSTILSDTNMINLKRYEKENVPLNGSIKRVSH